MTWDGVERREEDVPFDGQDKRKRHMNYHDQKEDIRQYHTCQRDAEIRLLIYQMQQMQEYFEEIKPIIIFAETEKKRREQQAQLCAEMTHEVMKWGIIGVLTAISAYSYAHFKQWIEAVGK